MIQSRLCHYHLHQSTDKNHFKVASDKWDVVILLKYYGSEYSAGPFVIASPLSGTVVQVNSDRLQKHWNMNVA